MFCICILSKCILLNLVVSKFKQKGFKFIGANVWQLFYTQIKQFSTLLNSITRYFTFIKKYITLKA